MCVYKKPQSETGNKRLRDHKEVKDCKLDLNRLLMKIENSTRVLIMLQMPVSELAPSTQLAAPPQNQPAKRARQTQSTFPHTPLKRENAARQKSSNISSTRQTRFSQQNSQPNKHITRSHTACHSQPAKHTLTQTTTPSIPQDNSTSSFTQQISNINPTYRIHNDPTYENTDYIEPQTPKKKKMQAL